MTSLAASITTALPGRPSPLGATPLQSGTNFAVASGSAEGMVLCLFDRSGTEATELGWYTPSGTVMTPADWADPSARSLTLYLDGSDDPDRSATGRLLVDDDFLVLVNAWWQPLQFIVPPTRPGQMWYPEIDTFDPTAPPTPASQSAGATITVRPRSIVVLCGPLGSTRA